MSAEIALRNGAATLPVPEDVEASPVVRRPKDNLDRPTEIIHVRPSQAAVDQVYKVKQVGIGATVLLTILVPLLPAVIWGVPWYGENVLRPESQAKITNQTMTANALASFAEAQKLQQENERTRVTNEARIQPALDALTTEIRGLRSEVRELRGK